MVFYFTAALFSLFVTDDNSHSERVTKRKRHFIISDDEDVKCSPKRSRDDDDCVVIDDGDDELEEINDPTDSDSDYTDESPKSKRRNKHLHVPHEISSTNNPNPGIFFVSSSFLWCIYRETTQVFTFRPGHSGLCPQSMH